MAFIKAKQTGKQRVTYWNEDGSSETRVGGNWTWRNLNPGNIGAGAWAIIKSPAKKKISAVRKDKKGTIVGYFVEELGWLPKKRAILLAQNGEIDAVVTRSRAGSVYLKSRPDGVSENNLESMG